MKCNLDKPHIEMDTFGVGETIKKEPGGIEFQTKSEECVGDVNNLFVKLNSWKEESQRDFSKFMFNTYAQFSTIISSQSTVVNMSMNSFVEEISGLQAELSTVTQERNDLLETVENLSCRNRNLCDKLEAFEIQEEVDGSYTDNKDTEEPKMCPKENGKKKRARPSTAHVREPQREHSEQQSNFTPTEDTFARELVDQPPAALHEKSDYEDIATEVTQQPKKIVSSNQYDLDLDHGKMISQSGKENDVVDHQQEAGGVGEKKNTNVSEEFVQFEDRQGNIKTTLNRSGNKGRRKHACGDCPYTSTSRSHLKEHIENIHEKIKRHFCKECDYASYHKGDLTRHIKKVHEKSINVCEDCGYGVERKALLNSHRASVHGFNHNPRM